VTDPKSHNFTINDVGISVTGDRSTNVIWIESDNDTSVTFFASFRKNLDPNLRFAAFSARLIPVDALGREYFVVSRKKETYENGVVVFLHVSYTRVIYRHACKQIINSESKLSVQSWSTRLTQ
jgi:hypothetical protein